MTETTSGNDSADELSLFEEDEAPEATPAADEGGAADGDAPSADADREPSPSGEDESPPPAESSESPPPAEASEPPPPDAASEPSPADADREPSPADAANESPPANESSEPSLIAESSEPSPPDAASEPSPSADDPETLRDELALLRDQRVRLAADFDNYRKRTEDRLRTRWNHAQADLLARLLDPLDDLRRVGDCDPETATIESVVEGVGLVERKVARLLEEIGVEVVDPQGESFDPATMEAIMRVPTQAEEEDDMVERVVQRGFTLNGQLLRPARVAVYKAE